ncbi:hypothetical protein EVAR_96006_1 [Eumeta japonica]|uniref:Uncharacterized protein n=1 Tax=Eumeta variegata TaxID=151549 RepID=A0A4C1XFL4_EUMVA|nr:hypothetical protein EVAR_96006_1 [Eumeta japonica]
MWNTNAFSDSRCRSQMEQYLQHAGKIQNTYLNSDEVDIATMEIENHMRIYADNSRETAGTSGQEPSSSYRLSPYEKRWALGCP